MDFTGKRLLILAGAGVHNKVVRAAKEMGIYTIVTDNIENSPAKMIADESWMYSITDVDAIVERCKKDPVDGVVNFCIDPGQRPYLQICSKLCLPCYTDAGQLAILTDKRRFKEYCLAHNVDVIPEYTIEDILDNNAEYPVFIKPADSRGSRGQSVCYGRKEALKGIEFAKSESRSGGYICEKYMQGYQDIGSTFYVIDGEPYLVKFADRFLGKAEDNMDKQVMCMKHPAAFDPTVFEEVQDRTKQMIKSLGIRFGPVFMQGFVDGDTIRYYDPAQRMPGGDYDLILKKVTGFDTVKTMIHFALTGDTKIHYGNPRNSFLLNGGTALMITVSVRPGKMSHVSGFDVIIQHPFVVYGRQIIDEGAIIPATGDVRQRVAEIGAYIPQNEDIKEFVKFFYETYHITDENNEDMIISRYVV